MDLENVCTVCFKTGHNKNKLFTCNYCFNKVHLKCLHDLGGVTKQNESQMHFCSSKCCSKYDRISSSRMKNDPNLSQLIEELQSAMLANTQTVREQVKSVTSAVEASQQFLSDKFESILVEFQNLKDENKRLKQEIEQIKSSQSTLSAMVYKQELELDRQNKMSITNNAVVLVVPFKQNENLSEICSKIFDKIGAASGYNSVLSMTRMSAGDKNPMAPIRIVFRDKKSKDFVFARKKESGTIISTMIDPKLISNEKSSYITIRDELTPLSTDLLNELRKVQERLNLKYVWAGRGGVILVKKDANAKTSEIRNRLDLNKLINTQH